MSKTSKITLIPVMLCFFAMGFVDLVGIASNFVKQDLSLSDSVANILPSLVFFWFLIFSVPTGVLMNKIGRKKTVLLSLVVTVVSLLLPIVSENFYVMLVSFSLLGIGNTLMQTSLNPLVSTVIKGNLASTLTFGQFVKAIASFMAPYIAMWGAMATIPSFGLGWRILFPVYMVVGIVAILLLGSTPIEEERADVYDDGADTLGRQFVEAFRLLGKPVVLLSFLGIMCHVGIDVGTNTTAPKILMERLGMTLNDAAFATSLYFIFRTIGCLTGSFFLRVMKSRTSCLHPAPTGASRTSIRRSSHWTATRATTSCDWPGNCCGACRVTAGNIASSVSWASSHPASSSRVPSISTPATALRLFRAGQHARCVVTSANRPLQVRTRPSAPISRRRRKRGSHGS